MPNELKVDVLLTGEDKIGISTSNYENFKEYIANSKNTFVYCMQGDKLLRIQINNGSHQKDSTNQYQLEVKSVSTINGNDGWKKEVERVEEIKELLCLSEEKKSQEIEIFKDFRLRLEKLAGEKTNLQTQLTQVEEKIKELEAANQGVKQEKTNLETQLAQANTNLENARKEAEDKQQELRTELDAAEQLKNAFVAYLKREGEKSKDQVQGLTQLFQQENDKQEIEGLVQKLDEINKSLETGKLNDKAIEELNKLPDTKEKVIAKLIAKALSKDVPSEELEWKEELNTQIENLNKQLKVKDEEIAKLEQQQPNAEVEKLKKDLEAKNTEVQQLQKKNKELEAKNKTTEQPKQGNGARYTATVGMGLATGLVAFTALERTVRLDIWVMVGIAVASALAVSGVTYLALKPSTEVNETKKAKNAKIIVYNY